MPASLRPAPGRASRGVALVLVAITAALLVAACGSSKSSSSSSSASAGSSSKSLTLGTKDFPEEFILGQLYKQALEAKGYKVTYKENIGATEIVDKALTSGQIDAYPEYTGESAVTVGKINQTVTSAQQEYGLAKAFYAKRGQVMSDMTPFFDTDAIGVKAPYAKAHALVSTGDLRKVAHFRLGARPEFLNREQGAAGMKKDYGLNNFTFKSLALGVQYQALDSGAVDAIDVFTTDAQLASGKYATLTDPKHIFGFQNIALVINKAKLAQLGGDTFMSIINSVNKLLTTPAIVTMNKAVAIDKQPAATVAQQFLKANSLI